jgi:hypothetical protein
VDHIDVRGDVVVCEPIIFAVVSLKPTGLRANPEVSRSIFIDRFDKIVPQAVRVIGVVTVYYKIISIVPVQSILRADPYKAQTILKDAPDDVAGEPLFARDPLKAKVRWREARSLPRVGGALDLGRCGRGDWKIW